MVQHYIAGISASFLQHAEFITGLTISGRGRKKFNGVLTHSFCGYVSQLVGRKDSHFSLVVIYFSMMNYVPVPGFVWTVSVASVMLSTAAAPRKWLSLGLFLISTVGTIALYFVEKQQAHILKLSFHRAQCPVLQRL